MIPPTIAPAVIALKIKKIIRVFEESATISPLTAKTPEELGLHPGMMFGRLVRMDVLVEVGDNRYYLNYANLATYEEAKQRRIFRVIILLAFLAFLLLIFSLNQR